MKQGKYLLSLLSALLVTSNSSHASNESNSSSLKETITMPYIFSTDSTGFSAGIGMIKRGIFQPQTIFVGSIYAGMPQETTTKDGQKKEKSFYGGIVSFSNYKLPYTNRAFFSILASKDYYPKEKYYFNGSNTSTEQDAFHTSGSSTFINSNLRYVLPIAEGIDNPQRHYTLRNGFVLDRDQSGNGIPLTTGITSIGIKTFYQSNTSDRLIEPNKNHSNSNSPKWNTNGLRFYLEHDNTDFDLNPSRGYHFNLQYSKDFGKGDSLQSWDFLEFKLNKYYNLDTFSFTNQNVLALSLWTGYSPSWNNDKEIYKDINANRPPLWEGARLGGFNRLRAYDNNRFSDKAAFYLSAEYRAVLKYNPLKDNKMLPVTVDWFQIVPFIEAGRVNEQYNADLLTDMKYDAGISLRAMVVQMPVRFDIAYGSEGANVWAMIQHPFDF